MVLEFQADPNCAHLDLQYMLGPSLLVRPLFDAGTSCRVYLPKGVWYDHWTDQAIKSAGRRIDLDALTDRIPLFIRGGSIIPTVEPKPSVSQMSFDKITLEFSAAPGEHESPLAWPGMALKHIPWHDDGLALNLDFSPGTRITRRVHRG